MSNVTIQKREKYYQYKFETAKIDGKRKFSSKSGFRTKAEAEKDGQKFVTYVSGFKRTYVNY